VLLVRLVQLVLQVTKVLPVI
jgi:hypothetical protein